MNKILLILFLFSTSLLYSQDNENSITLFAQCHFSISDQSEFDSLQLELKQSPFIKMARLDWHTQRAIFLTKDISSLSNDDLKSWFGRFADSVRCIQIGVHGVDRIDPYPFQNCND